MNHPINSEYRRIILLPPEKSLLDKISYRFDKRKIVWARKLNDRSVIALNEWNSSYLAVRILVGIPVLLIFIPCVLVILTIVLPVSLFDKKKADDIFKLLFGKVAQISCQNFTMADKYNLQDFVKRYQNPVAEISPRRIMYVHVSQKSLLFKINAAKVNQFIDEFWIYKYPSDIIDRAMEGGAALNESFIVGYDILSQYPHWKANYNERSKQVSNFQWLNVVAAEELAAKEKKAQEKIRIKQEQDKKNPRITLHPNDFLNNEVVLYYESSWHPEINDYLQKNYDRINRELAKKDMQFIYIPQISHAENAKRSLDETKSFAEYEFPEIFSGDERISLVEDVFNNFDIAGYYSNLSLALGIPSLEHPFLLHSIDYEKTITPTRPFLYSVAFITGTNDRELNLLLEEYFKLVRIAENKIYFQQRSSRSQEYDADEEFHPDGHQIGQELKQVISSLKSLNNEKLVLASMVYMIKSFKDSQPLLCEKLNSLLFKTINSISEGPSRLVIDDRYRIFLPDYNNIEIELTPLPKTLYIFLLNHPEGVLFKELVDYREELTEIYCRIGNRLDMEQITKSVIDLTDSRSNSVNEKCSRIKEAFLSKMDDSIARHYYVTGDRGENKLIALDRSLLHLSETK
jgi:hypothetical protein